MCVYVCVCVCTCSILYIYIYIYIYIYTHCLSFFPFLHVLWCEIIMQLCVSMLVHLTQANTLSFVCSLYMSSQLLPYMYKVCTTIINNTKENRFFFLLCLLRKFLQVTFDCNLPIPHYKFLLDISQTKRCWNSYMLSLFLLL